MGLRIIVILPRGLMGFILNLFSAKKKSKKCLMYKNIDVELLFNVKNLFDVSKSKFATTFSNVV